jgi:starch-binding outer membrane protein, SusD/RagB family
MKKIIFIIFCVSLSTSCKKYLDRTPLDSITTEGFFTNSAEANQALVGVYNGLGVRTISPGFNNATSYYSKFDLYTEIGSERDVNNTMTIAWGAYPTNFTSVTEIWAGFYAVVQRANTLLFYLPKLKNVLDAQEYASIEAQTKTLRGLAYWHLVVFYGDVPFFTKPLTSAEFAGATRTPKKDIVSFLIKDLKEAATALPWTPTQRGRVSRGVALGSAARLAMVNKQYADVVSLTDEIIANGGYGLNPVFSNLFRKSGMESNTANEIMFYYPFGETDNGSFSNLSVVQDSRNNAGGQSSHFSTQFLVDLFECTDGLNIAQSPLYDPAKPNHNRDPRLAQTVIVPGDTLIVQGNQPMIFTPTNPQVFLFNTTTRAITVSPTLVNQDSISPFGARAQGLGYLWKKYLQDRETVSNNLYKTGWIYMRFAEILLLNAEAKFENGVAAGEVAPIVNRVRSRSRMPNVSAAVIANANAFRQLIRREKTVELANEGIHIADMRRWDDGAYAEKVMNIGRMVGAPTSNMRLVSGRGFIYNTAAAVPGFDAQLLVPTNYSASAAARVTRGFEVRSFVKGKHELFPIPQADVDRSNRTLQQNPGW